MGGDPNLIKSNIDETTCRRCHKVPHIETTESFVFNEKVLHVLGDGHGLTLKKKLEAAAGGSPPK